MIGTWGFDDCGACGHARAFHQVGAGNGVPVGQKYCDDRHSDPCACKGFVVVGPAYTLEADIQAVELYLASCVRRRDWHGVSDAANDLRVLEAKRDAR